jgi:carbonic anhydrase
MLKEEALARIAEGVRHFQTDVYPAQREMFQRLQRGQDPLAFFITCSDSRLVPNLITQTEPGEIFIERNPGNLVPDFEPFVGGVTSSVEYAMLALKVPLLIVCGHTDCGVMKALLHPEGADHLPGVKQWMRHAGTARERVLREHADEPDAVQLQHLTRYNVLTQIEHLKSHPSVKERLAAGEIDIRGWVYDIGSGSIWQFDPKTGVFADTREVEAPARS